MVENGYKKTIIGLVVLLATVTIGSIVYIHERDVDSIAQNRINIEKNEDDIKILKEYKAADEQAKINLTESIDELTAAVKTLNETVIRLEEQMKR